MEQKQDLPTSRYSPAGNYDVDFIMKVMAEIENGLPAPKASRKYNIKKSTIYRWLQKYSPKGARPVLRRVLSVQDKRTLVRAVAAGRMSIDDAAVSYQVCKDSVRCWLRESAKENGELALSNEQKLKKKDTNKDESTAAGERVRQLQQQLADAQLKIAALDTLIDVAEEQLKIDIRKKPGARQS